MAADANKGFQEFKEHVIAMAGRVLFNKKKAPLHAVQAVAPEPPVVYDDEDSELMAALATANPDDMVAAVMKWKGKFSRGGGGSGRADGDGCGKRF